MYKCEILADSLSHGHRLTTFCVTYPRQIHAEFLTHGMLVRNGESSRARPVGKNIADVEEHPFVPEAFGRNQAGMQFDQVLAGDQDAHARMNWLFASEDAVGTARALEALEVHKSYANRLLEPFKWYTAIYTATDWSNFFALRTHADAQKEFQIIALMMREAYESNDPRLLTSGEWHLPLVTDAEIHDDAITYVDPVTDWTLWKRVSIGRCARVSYLTHEGKRSVDADLQLYDRLLSSGHMSPFGHVARPFTHGEWAAISNTQSYASLKKNCDNISGLFAERMLRNLEYCAHFRGWWQARADIENEADFALALALA